MGAPDGGRLPGAGPVRGRREDRGAGRTRRRLLHHHGGKLGFRGLSAQKVSTPCVAALLWPSRPVCADMWGPGGVIRRPLRCLMCISSLADVGGLRGLNSVYYQQQRQTDQPGRPASTRPPLLLTLLAFVLLRPLARLHEGPPACHPNALLINSILTQLSQG